MPNPCGSDIDKPSSRETSCDEYPFAGTVQGGQGSLLRCTTPRQNTGEGGALGRFFQKYCGTKNCEFIMSSRIPRARMCYALSFLQLADPSAEDIVNLALAAGTMDMSTPTTVPVILWIPEVRCYMHTGLHHVDADAIYRHEGATSAL